MLLLAGKLNHPTKWLKMGLLLWLGLSALAAYWWISPGSSRHSRRSAGRHNLDQNALWMQHGWLGSNDWFRRHRKLHRIKEFRSPQRLRQMAHRLKRYRIRDLYPHAGPVNPTGDLPALHIPQTKAFLLAFQGFRTFPWIGGLLNRHIHPNKPAWRRRFVSSVTRLLHDFPEFAGVHINIEPWPRKHTALLALMQELKHALPPGKLLSISAYPPPLPIIGHLKMHWDQTTFLQLAQFVDQFVVMMYNSSLHSPNAYSALMSRWTRLLLRWFKDKPNKLLLGIPSYRNEGRVHSAKAENIPSALEGIHHALIKLPELPPQYQGIAIYCEWEMKPTHWAQWAHLFIKKNAHAFHKARQQTQN